MDDDTIPSETCLEKLLMARKILHEHAPSEEVSFLASSVYGPKGEYMNVPELDKRPSSNGYPAWTEHLSRGMVRIESATFVSILVSRRAVEKCGLPCRDFFIWGDDVEYTYRLTTYCAPAFLVGDSIAIHKRTGGQSLGLAHEQSDTRLRFFFYSYRNNGIIRRYYHGSKPWLSYVFKNLFFSYRYLKSNRPFLRLSVLWRGVSASLFQYGEFKRFIDQQLSKNQKGNRASSCIN